MASHDEALRKASDLKPDVLTLDLTMPGGTGVNVIQTLSRESPATRVVVLAMHDDAAYFRVAMAVGAFGYVVKQSADTELLNAIHCVAQGKIVSIGTARAETNPLATLSERELEVLVLIAQGHSNQATADQLDLSVKTVESYRARLMTTLGLHNRGGPARQWWRSGLGRLRRVTISRAGS
jgi:two-component system, NarL family, response regulator NreC